MDRGFTTAGPIRTNRNTPTKFDRRPSECTQIVRHLAELLDHLGVAEIPGGRVASAAKCDRADVTFLARQRLFYTSDPDKTNALRRAQRMPEPLAMQSGSAANDQ